MTEQTTSTMSAQQLMRLITAYRLSQAIHVAASLSIADLLAGGPRTFDDLAVSTKGHAPSLYRLLRALASEGIFEELPGRRFANNAASEMLRSDTLTSVYGWAVLIGRAYFWQGWGNLLHSVQTGESGVRKVTGVDSWRYREQHPEEGAVFDRAMTDTTRALSAAIVEAYDFGQFKRIADIAGGHGAQLAAILVRYPGATGVLFDQPHVVAGATELLRDARVGDRCEVVGGSFFETVPHADAYVLKHILHDWDDEDCVRILRTLRSAASVDARLLVIERIIGPANEDPDTKLSDLNMLVGPGGQERTREEFAELFAIGGWRLVDAHGAGARHIIEGVLA
jgi:hypothetical protein